MQILNRFSKWIATAALALTAGTSMAYTLIDTNPSWDGTTFISSFGNPNTATYGQTVTVPSGESFLGSFSFQINDRGSVFPFQAAVFAWDSVNSMATGPALFFSTPVTTTGANAYVRFTFTPNVPVVAGQQYVLMATTSNNQTPPTGVATRWGALTNDTTYPGGRFVFINNGTNTAAWTTQTWSNIAEDLAFTAVFGTPVVPALDQWALLLLAALVAAGAFVVARRRA
jgi:hypothetical protein